MVSSECKLNIARAFYQHTKNEISFDRAVELSQKEIDRINALAKSWDKAYNSKSENCLFVKYWYGNSDGIKTTLTDYYSLDENRYKEGNYPYLKKEFDSDYGFNFYEDVVNEHKELLLEIVND